MADIEFVNIEKVYPNGVRAVRDLNMRIADGEFMVVVGPSGCGKTTALRMCAGLEDISGGELKIEGRVVNRLQPQQRNISMVFQNYALYPHMSVRKNLEFPLQMRKLARLQIDEQVLKVAKMLELDNLLERKPKQLSGGQRQRVAMGRALVRNPVAFLMDEPLSNLDAKLRVQMRAEISSLQRKTGTTALYVTHDQVEAMTMGDRVAVMRLGILQQVAEPHELYREPVNLFVAAFIGSPSMNLFKGRLSGEGDGMRLHFGEQSVAIDAATLRRWPQLEGHDGSGLTFGLRPEAFVPPENVAADRRMKVTTNVVELLGHEQMIFFDLPVEAVRIQDAGAEEEELGGRNLHAVARVSAESEWHEGQEDEIGVDTRQLQVFDVDGKRLLVAEEGQTSTAEVTSSS